MRPAAPGFRAAPSHAAAPMRDWPSAPPNTAIAKPTPAAIATKPRLLSATGAYLVCANAGAAHSATAIADNNSKMIFLILNFSFKELRPAESDAVWYDFARIRYPPPLLQRRSCDTDINKL